jgi:hypothetical protein
MNNLNENWSDVQIQILAEDGSTWNILNKLLTENRKLDEYSVVKREEKREQLIKHAQNMMAAWITIVYPNRVLRVVS